MGKLVTIGANKILNYIKIRNEYIAFMDKHPFAPFTHPLPYYDLVFDFGEALLECPDFPGFDENLELFYQMTGKRKN